MKRLFRRFNGLWGAYIIFNAVAYIYFLHKIYLSDQRDGFQKQLSHLNLVAFLWAVGNRWNQSGQ